MISEALELRIMRSFINMCRNLPTESGRNGGNVFASQILTFFSARNFVLSLLLAAENVPINQMICHSYFFYFFLMRGWTRRAHKRIATK